MHEEYARLILELLASRAATTIVLFDVRVFNTFAECNLSSNPAATFQRHEVKKVELTRSVYKRWKAVLILLCSLLQGASGGPC